MEDLTRGVLGIIVGLLPIFLLMWFDSDGEGKSEKEIIKSESMLKVPMTNSHKIPKGLHKCGKCGEYKGSTNDEVVVEKDEGYLTASCLYEGILCHKCKKNKIHRPISNYYDQRTNQIWHHPYFTGMMGCGECKER